MDTYTHIHILPPKQSDKVVLSEKKGEGGREGGLAV